MSQIPFKFIPIPSYFRDHGWFEEPNCMTYVLWAFSRCSSTSKKVYVNHKEVFLEPFEYVSGLDVSKRETGLSHQQIRTQVLHLVEAKMLQKVTSKSTNKFTVYRWVTERFNENDNNQINTIATSNQQAANNNQE